MIPDTYHIIVHAVYHWLGDVNFSFTLFFAARAVIPVRMKSHDATSKPK